MGRRGESAGGKREREREGSVFLPVFCSRGEEERKKREGSREGEKKSGRLPAALIGKESN